MTVENVRKEAEELERIAKEKYPISSPSDPYISNPFERFVSEALITISRQLSDIASIIERTTENKK